VNDCDCCETPAAAIPAEFENRPWLSAVGYRIGTFATFRKALTDALSRTPLLAGLTARVDDDYTITTIDLWSAVADVLTFYQERTANESFHRTATLRDSMLRLVRLIDYQLAPGAAATTQLAFTLDPGTTALIPVGTRVQSVPGQGQKPQKFETLIAIPADARFNRLRLFPAPSATEPTGADSDSVTVAPDADALAGAAALAPGDRVMLYAPGALEVLTVAELRPRDDDLTIRWTLPVEGAGFEAAFDAHDPTIRAHVLGRSFHLFGFDAPSTVVVPEQSDPTDDTTAYLTTADTDYSLDGGTGNAQISLDARYPGLKAGSLVLAVATTTSGTTAIPFSVAASSELHMTRTATTALPTEVTTQSGTVTRLDLSPLDLDTRTLADLLSSGGDIRDVVVYELLGAPLRFWPYAYPSTIGSSTVYLPGRRSGWSTVEVGRTIEKGVGKPGTTIEVNDLAPGRALLLTDGRGGTPIAGTISGAAVIGAGVSFGPTDTDPSTVEDIGLAPDETTPITVIVSGALDDPANLPNTTYELTVTIGSFPVQTIALDASTLGSGALADVAAALQAALQASLPGAPTFARALAWAMDGAIAVAPGVPGDRVVFGPSINDPDTVMALGLDATRARFLDGVVSAPIAPLLGTFPAGDVRVTLGVAAPADLPINVAVWTPADLSIAIQDAFSLTTLLTADDRVLVLPPLPRFEQRAFLRLALDVAAPFALDAATAVMLGNAGPASHGETVHAEIVGDGDASQPFQRFTLKKKPITYVPAATPGGVASSLQLLVSGVLWKEVPTLYGAEPTDQVYVTRIADDGTMTVQFGDGVAGARLPSGRQNIVATYRQGIGVAGRVGATKLTTLLDRPTGVKNATNPISADGGADPETMERAREAAPGTVRTFGRAVSLRDFEDTALMAGEVAKASATWVWTGELRAIHLTIAAQGGAVFSADGLARIRATLATERDPNHKLLIDNYTPVAVIVDASILVDDRYLTEQVLAAARTALLDALSFERRRFAEPVYLSDTFRVLQDVEGVLSVDVNVLDLKSTDASFRAAHGIDDSLGEPQPHLLMLPARPVGSMGTVLPAELAWVEVPAQDVTLLATGGISL
jgi:hypothetical protein